MAFDKIYLCNLYLTKSAPSARAGDWATLPFFLHRRIFYLWPKSSTQPIGADCVSIFSSLKRPHSRPFTIPVNSAISHRSLVVAHVLPISSPSVERLQATGGFNLMAEQDGGLSHRQAEAPAYSLRLGLSCSSGL